MRTIEEKLNKRKSIVDDCWVWTGGTNNVGYGMLRVQSKMRLVHRVSYEHHVGPIPAGKYVCHSCYNYRCFNPAHLYLATKKENVQRMVDDNRHIGRHRAYKPVQVTCEHCNKSMSYHMYVRWHGDNCRNKH